MKRIKIKSHFSELKKIRAFLKKNLKPLNLSEQDYYIIELSLLEICINVMRYAYPRKAGEISLQIWQENSNLFIEIRDDGIPFDPGKIEAPDIQEILKSKKKGGLGVFLTKKLMDGFHYERKNEQNILTINKFLP